MVVAKENIHQKVSDYYSKVLKNKNDLKTSACCAIDTMPDQLKVPLKLISDEIHSKFYGCGAPFPLELKGKKILDLGCGTGRDCYLLSYLAGEKGEVVGIDMLDDQLTIANKHLKSQIDKFGYKKPNVRFVQGYIEELDILNLPKNYFDVVISNCVLNLSPNKKAVLEGLYQLLKKGGEFFFSDVYCDRRLPLWAKEDPILLGECLGGALYWKDFERISNQVGFKDTRVYASSKIDLLDEETIKKVGFANFRSITYRLFKLPQLESACEDYGQTATYLGSIESSSDQFKLDNHHLFLKGEPLSVCSNTAFMLSETRFNAHFKIAGDLNTHYGLFEACGESAATAAQSSARCC